MNKFSHIARKLNQCLTKRLLFNANPRTKIGRPKETPEDKVTKSSGLTKGRILRRSTNAQGTWFINPDEPPTVIKLITRLNKQVQVK